MKQERRWEMNLKGLNKKKMKETDRIPRTAKSKKWEIIAPFLI